MGWQVSGFIYRVRQPRISRRASFIQAMQQQERARGGHRPSGVFITVPNASVKMAIMLGDPVRRVKRVGGETIEGFRQFDYTFNLPVGWVKTEPPVSSSYGMEVARNPVTGDRVIVNSNAVCPMSEINSNH